MVSSPKDLHKHGAKKKISFALLLISDTRSTELKEGKPSSDKSLTLIESLLKEQGHQVPKKIIVADEVPEIKDAIMDFLDDDSIDVIITTGGTGISQRDVTVEAIMPLLDKKIEGFGELFRYLSYMDIGSAAMMSRAFAGVTSSKVLFCLPGSPNACKLAVEKLILPEAGHALKMMGKGGGA